MDKNRRSTSTSGSSASNDCLQYDRPPHQRRRWSILQILLSNILTSPQIIMKKKKTLKSQHSAYVWTVSLRYAHEYILVTEPLGLVPVCAMERQTHTNEARAERKKTSQNLWHIRSRTLTHTAHTCGIEKATTLKSELRRDRDLQKYTKSIYVWLSVVAAHGTYNVKSSAIKTILIFRFHFVKETKKAKAIIV